MIHLKQITEDDLEFARRLRNSNRQYFFNTRYVTRKEHLAWFKSTKKGLYARFYIIWDDKKRVGTISIKRNEIGNVLIEEKSRGKGFLRKVLGKIQVKNVCVKVRPDNEVGIAIYKALGFKEKERILWK